MPLPGNLICSTAGVHDLVLPCLHVHPPLHHPGRVQLPHLQGDQESNHHQDKFVKVNMQYKENNLILLTLKLKDTVTWHFLVFYFVFSL